jgi:hypothetical protein
VISVVFALVAGTAFAEINFGGGVFGKVNVMEGDSTKTFKANDDLKGGTTEGKDVNASGYFGRVRLEASGTNDDETFGGWARLDSSYGNEIKGYGYAWWQPISLIKFTVGTNGGDGFFDAWGGAGYGFYAGAGDLEVAKETWKYSSAFYGSFGALGAILTITPLEALEINIGIPFMDAAGRGEDVYKKTNAQVAYNIDGVGKLAITYVGDFEGQGKNKITGAYDDDNDPDTKDKADDAVNIFKLLPFYTLGNGDKLFLLPAEDKEATDYIGKFGSRNNSKFYAFFDLSSIENLGVQLSVGFTLPSKDILEELNDDKDASKGKQTYTVNYMPPVAVGLAASYDAGAFGIKARIQGQFAESLKYEFEDTTPGIDAKEKSGSYEMKGPFRLDADILPSFAINDSMKAYLSAGLALRAAYSYDVLDYDNKDANGNTTANSKAIKSENTTDAVVGWHINPYFTKSAGAGTFYAGFRLWSDGAKTNIVDFGKQADGTLDKSDPVKKAVVNWQVPVGVSFSF